MHTLNANAINANTVLGANALNNITTGNQNTFIGVNASWFLSREIATNTVHNMSNRIHGLKDGMHVIDKDTVYIKHGKIHREDGPALVVTNWYNDLEIWVSYGKIHRDGDERAVKIKDKKDKKDGLYAHNGNLFYTSTELREYKLKAFLGE